MRRHEVFLRAAEVIAKHGHFKGAYHGPDGEACVLGALSDASSGESYRLWPRLVAGVSAIVEPPRGGLPEWNDRPVRSPADVIAALDAAAVVAMQEAGLEPEDVL